MFLRIFHDRVEFGTSVWRTERGVPFHLWSCLLALFMIGIFFSLLALLMIALSFHRAAYVLLAYWSITLLALAAWEAGIHSRRSGKHLFNSHRRATRVFGNSRYSKLDESIPLADLSVIRIGPPRVDVQSGEQSLSLPVESREHVAPHVLELEREQPTERGTCYDLYTHSPLSRVENEIRLFQVQPSEDESAMIHANLVYLPLMLAKARGYTALSYTWGSEEASVTILIDGKQFLVRPNLMNILRKLRAMKYSYIWIDAICINQNDLQECSAQVVRMQAIYASAQSVLVAINLATEPAEKVGQAISSINPELPQKTQMPEIEDMLSDDSIQNAFEIFCNNSYWERIWIVQEFAIGAKVDLMIGNSVVTATKLDPIMQALRRQPQSKRWTRAYTIFRIRHAWHTDKPIRLLELLGRTSKSLSARRHDRIFGLMGLVPDALKFLTEPSYEADLNEMTVSMTRSYIERHSLDIILSGPIRSPSSTLPTWTPDYFHFDKCEPDRRVIGLSLADSMEQPEYGPRVKWNATGNVSKNIHFHGDIIVSSGRRIGSITSLGMAWTDASDSGYPTHTKEMNRRGELLNIRKLMQQAMLQDEYEYNPPFQRKRGETRTLGYNTRMLGYSYVRAFLESHGTPDPKSPDVDLLKWISGNRKFFVGDQTLQDHARELWHPFFSCGDYAWQYSYFRDDHADKSAIWFPFRRMAGMNMRLMCLDDETFGIGWAAFGACLYDELFLLPGCSVPVVLRRKAEGKYEFVGDAIVIGAMENEVWGKTTSEDLVQVEIA